ncbi:MAG: TIGR03667 family PPOX class F420-dependent oxidoreductase [Chloroflexota bacterium]|nr:TIGR03667 family PPOX class F420-dependent oxidoreductase [Chloroflexota bacterium]
MLIDEATRFGARVAERLRTETIIWLTVAGRDGTPHPNPVWFHWEGGDSVLVYNRRDAQRLRAIERNPRVALHFDSDKGGNIVIFQGLAKIEPNEPPAHTVTAYVERYRARIERMHLTPAAFAAAYPIATRIRLTKLLGF